MNCSLGMLGWGIERGKLYGTVPGVEEIVPGASRHKDSVTRIHTTLNIQLVSRPSHAHNPLTLFHTKKLIRIRMHFHADFAANRDAHDRHLQMASRPKRCAEIGILLSCICNICHKRLAA